MKPTQEQVIAWARKYGDWNGQTVEMNDVGLEAAYAAAYDAGRKDEALQRLNKAAEDNGEEL